MSQFITSTSPMPRGYAGQLTRGFFDNTVETKEADGSVAFGALVKLGADGKVKAAAAAADATAVYGFALREYGQADASGVQATPFVGVLRRGYVAVAVAAGTAAPGGAVYLNATGAITAEKASNTAVPGAVFCGAAEGGIAEIAFNI